MLSSVLVLLLLAGIGVGGYFLARHQIKAAFASSHLGKTIDVLKESGEVASLLRGKRSADPLSQSPNRKSDLVQEAMEDQKLKSRLISQILSGQNYSYHQLMMMNYATTYGISQWTPEIVATQFFGVPAYCYKSNYSAGSNTIHIQRECKSPIWSTLRARSIYFAHVVSLSAMAGLLQGSLSPKLAGVSFTLGVYQAISLGKGLADPLARLLIEVSLLVTMTLAFCGLICHSTRSLTDCLTVMKDAHRRLAATNGLAFLVMGGLFGAYIAVTPQYMILTTWRCCCPIVLSSLAGIAFYLRDKVRGIALCPMMMIPLLGLLPTIISRDYFSLILSSLASLATSLVFAGHSICGGMYVYQWLDDEGSPVLLEEKKSLTQECQELEQGNVGYSRMISFVKEVDEDLELDIANMKKTKALNSFQRVRSYFSGQISGSLYMVAAVCFLVFSTQVQITYSCGQFDVSCWSEKLGKIQHETLREQYEGYVPQLPEPVKIGIADLAPSKLSLDQGMNELRNVEEEALKSIKRATGLNKEFEKLSIPKYSKPSILQRVAKIEIDSVVQKNSSCKSLIRKSTETITTNNKTTMDTFILPWVEFPSALGIHMWEGRYVVNGTLCKGNLALNEDYSIDCESPSIANNASRLWSFKNHQKGSRVRRTMGQPPPSDSIYDEQVFGHISYLENSRDSHGTMIGFSGIRCPGGAKMFAWKGLTEWRDYIDTSEGSEAVIVNPGYVTEACWNIERVDYRNNGYECICFKGNFAELCPCTSRLKQVQDGILQTLDAVTENAKASIDSVKSLTTFTNSAFQLMAYVGQLGGKISEGLANSVNYLIELISVDKRVMFVEMLNLKRAHCDPRYYSCSRVQLAEEIRRTKNPSQVFNTSTKPYDSCNFEIERGDVVVTCLKKSRVPVEILDIQEKECEGVEEPVRRAKFVKVSDKCYPIKLTSNVNEMNLESDFSDEDSMNCSNLLRSCPVVSPSWPVYRCGASMGFVATNEGNSSDLKILAPPMPHSLTALTYHVNNLLRLSKHHQVLHTRSRRAVSNITSALDLRFNVILEALRRQGEYIQCLAHEKNAPSWCIKQMAQAQQEKKEEEERYHTVVDRLRQNMKKYISHETMIEVALAFTLLHLLAALTLGAHELIVRYRTRDLIEMKKHVRDEVHEIILKMQYLQTDVYHKIRDLSDSSMAALTLSGGSVDSAVHIEENSKETFKWGNRRYAVEIKDGVFKRDLRVKFEKLAGKSNATVTYQYGVYSVALNGAQLKLVNSISKDKNLDFMTALTWFGIMHDSSTIWCAVRHQDEGVELNGMIRGKRYPLTAIGKVLRMDVESVDALINKLEE